MKIFLNILIFPLAISEWMDDNEVVLTMAKHIESIEISAGRLIREDSHTSTFVVVSTALPTFLREVTL